MKKILIIEDDQIVANIYRNKLIVQGYQVEVANTGETGHDLIRSFRPDAVVLDLVLPKLSGVELMKLVRAEPDFAKLPIIVFSNTYLTQMVEEAWKAGATKCLSKANCTPRQVIEAIGSAISTNGVAVTPLSAPETAVKTAAPAPTSEPAAKSAPIFDVEFEIKCR